MDDTIVGISSSGAISILRLSGSKSLEIVSELLSSKNKLKDREICYGKIVDKGVEIDEVLVAFMKSPKSYTKEDVVEIYCHGNRIIAQKIMNSLVDRGAKIADRGEFTKRAFLNGRIDLTQAESVYDLINANSEKRIENSLRNLNGFLRKKVQKMREVILNSLANINVVSDYPEEVEDEFFHRKEIESLLTEIDSLISSYSTGRILREGIKVVIVGRPNVGKSSLMNRLLKSDRAIVSDVKGTTRDIIEERIRIKDIPITILDTAGIRDSQDKVEKIGIDLSKKSIEDADIILFVLDSSEGFTEEDRKIMEIVKHKKYILIKNKRDLAYLDQIDGLNFSATEDEIEIIENRIEKLALDCDVSQEAIVDNLRHKNLFVKTKKSLEEFLQSDAPLDIASIHLSQAINSLGEIIGEVTTEDLLDNIFQNFCVGK